MNKVKWIGSHTCDFCKKEITDTLVDGKTVFGPWAVMCPSCYLKYGVGLGIGRGQQYKKEPYGDFVKVAG